MSVKWYGVGPDSWVHFTHGKLGAGGFQNTPQTLLLVTVRVSEKHQDY